MCRADPSDAENSPHERRFSPWHRRDSGRFGVYGRRSPRLGRQDSCVIRNEVSMPSPETILSLAATTANEYRTLAIGWHVFLGTILVALLAGWRPSNRCAGYVLVAPLFSVSALAWASGNPFNGATFAALALLLIGFATRLSTEPVNVDSSFLLLT